jgi:hypothetical protein
VRVNPEVVVALPNPPLQRTGASASRSKVARAATPRALPAALRGRATLAAFVRRPTAERLYVIQTCTTRSQRTTR